MGFKRPEVRILSPRPKKTLENFEFSRVFLLPSIFTKPYRICGLSDVALRLPAGQGAEAAHLSSSRLHLWQHLWQHSTGKPQLSKHGSQYQSPISSISSQRKDQCTLCSRSIPDPQYRRIVFTPVSVMAMQGSITGYARRGFACLPHEAIPFADMWRYIFPQPSPHDLSGRIRSEYATMDERRAP